MRKPLPLKWILLVLILVGAFSIIHTQRAYAGDYYLPDHDRVLNPDTGEPPNMGAVVEIAQPGPPKINLDVPETWVKVLYDPGKPVYNITLYDGDFGGCSTNPSVKQFDTLGASEACDHPFWDWESVDYNVYCADVTNRGASPAGGRVAFRNSVNFPNNGQAGIPVESWRCPTVDTGRGTKYVYYLQAVWVKPAPAGGRINGFWVAALDGYNGKTSYWGYPGNYNPGFPAGIGSYAVQDRFYPSDTESNFDFDFAPSCDFNGGTVFLKWRDADRVPGGVPPDGGQAIRGGDDPISFDLLENGNRIMHLDNVGGNFEYREIGFNAKKDAVYTWRWIGVNSDNGIQLWIPFDSANATLGACDRPPNPPTATTPPTGACTNNGTMIINNVRDPDWQGPLEIQIWRDGAYAKTETRNQGDNIVIGLGEFSDLNAHNYFARVFSKNSSGATNPGLYRDSNTISIGPCASPECGQMRVDGGADSAEPNSTFTMRVAVKIINLGSNADPISRPNPPSNPSGYRISATITRNDPANGSPQRTNPDLAWDPVSPPGKIPPGDTIYGLWTFDEAPGVPLADHLLAAHYKVTWTLHGPSGNVIINCPETGDPPQILRVERLPYFRSYGGDTVAGGGKWDVAANKVTGCNPPTGPAIWGPTTGSGGKLAGFISVINGPPIVSKGAGSQMASLALDQITDYSSALSRTSDPIPHSGLSLANTSSPAGNFGHLDCPPPYFADPPSSTNKITNPSENPGTLSPGNKSVWIADNDLTIKAATGNVCRIPVNTKVYIYAKKKVNIACNIEYDGVPWQIDTAPSVTIASEENIYIQPGVGQIAGLYVAKDTIYSCSNGGFGLPSRADLASAGAPCSNQLLVYGSFVAPNIRLLRTTNSLKDSVGGEREWWHCWGNPPPGPPPNCFHRNVSKAAEIFIFSPEQWLTNSAVPFTTEAGDYDFITSLPPLL